MWISKFIETLKNNLAQEELEYSKEERSKNISLSNILDPFAQEISWTPNKWGWASFKTNTLVESSLWNYEYKIAYSWLFLPGFFIFWSIAFSFWISQYILQEMKKWMIFNYEDWLIFAILPIIFFICALLIIKHILGVKRRFNTLNSICYVWKRIINFNEIYAIQIIWETVGRNSHGTYKSYEINLVLRNKERVNILDHGDKKSVLSDALIISNIIWVPIWNALKKQ